jgi:uncharacterized FlgJ-related protein
MFGILPILLIISLSYLIGYKLGLDTSIRLMDTEEKMFIIQSIDPFSEDELITMMRDLNIKLPHIPLAQSMLETGNWKSSMFLENHNLFGMKEATRRVSTAKGSNKGHAYYDTWRESVYDYAFYQCRYLGNIKTEDEYFQYLSASYAEDTSYVNKLKRIIENEGLRERFK